MAITDAQARIAGTGLLIVLMVGNVPAAERGTVTIPVITGHPEMQPFAGHPGWVDIYAPGDSRGHGARIGPERIFEIPLEAREHGGADEAFPASDVLARAREAFAARSEPLSDNASIAATSPGARWMITDGKRAYSVYLEGGPGNPAGRRGADGDRVDDPGSPYQLAVLVRDAQFEIEPPDGPCALIANFDRMETPPVIIPRWPAAKGDLDVPIRVEYICAPPGYPAVWRREYMQRAKDYWQTFIATCSRLSGCSFFDGPKIVWWGNKINISVCPEVANGDPILIPDHDGGAYDATSAGHSDFELPRIGWRYGDMDLMPNRKYAIRIGGYRSHGGKNFELDGFIRPDNGDGYGPGEALMHRSRTGGDLCFILFGNSHGQTVETHIRSEEWEILIPQRKPVHRWGQTFKAHGASLAGVSFWGSNGSDRELTARVCIREEGPDGKRIGPVKTVVAHPSADRPIIRYPDWPGELPGYADYYKLPSDLMQVAFVPDEVPLSQGKTYYVDIEASEPVMLYADGDYYDDGFAYYDGEKITRDNSRAFHSNRWTLAMSIVTYDNPGGAPNDFGRNQPRPKPGPDGNLVVNGGAETADFSWWSVGSDPVIDPSTHMPEPRNRSGNHRFGISIGWNKADMYQYQEIPDLEPGASYVAGFWATHGDGTDEFAQLLWCDGPFGGEEALLVETPPGEVKTWTRYMSEPFTPKGTHGTLIVRYKHTAPTNIASIHVDDITMKKAP